MSGAQHSPASEGEKESQLCLFSEMELPGKRWGSLETAMMVYDYKFLIVTSEMTILLYNAFFDMAMSGSWREEKKRERNQEAVYSLLYAPGKKNWDDFFHQVNSFSRYCGFF